MQLSKMIVMVIFIATFCLNFKSVYAEQTCGDKGTCTCFLTLSDINFKQYEPLKNEPLHAIFHVDVTCALNQKGSLPIDYKIHFSPGHSDNIKYRHMHSTKKDILKYNLHQEHEHKMILGDGLGGMVELSNHYILCQHLDNHSHHHNHHHHHHGHKYHSNSHRKPMPHHQSPHTDRYLIHAEIPVQPLANVGNYSDSIIVTLTY